jgi:uncharacterized protein
VQFSNKPLAVVTGASSGIGLELARQFAQHGFDVVVCAQGPGILTVAPTVQTNGSAVEAVQADLSTYGGVEALYAKIMSLGRPVDALALNAGVGVGGDFARETSLKAELGVIAVNVTSTVHLAKRVLADMVARGRGRVLFTASIAGMMPTPLEAVYGASKAFVLSFSEAVRNELRGTGVTVTTLLPGPTNTNFFRRAGLDDTELGTKAKHKNDPVDVAKQAFEAMMAGKERIVGASSIMTKLQGAVSKFIPDDVKAREHRKMIERHH